MMNGLWDQAAFIRTYTRVQAIENGVLVDVTSTAREAGFTWPLAMTAAAWADAVSWNQNNRELQDEAGRLWDVLKMARYATQRGGSGDRIRFQVLPIPNTAQATQEPTP